VTDQLKCTVDVVGYGAGSSGEASLVARRSTLWMKVLVGCDHLLWTVRWDAHVTHQVQRVIRVAGQPHQLVSLQQTPVHFALSLWLIGTVRARPETVISRAAWVQSPDTAE